MADELLSQSRKSINPSSSFKFRKTTCGKQDRSCQASCFIKYPWLHYDERFVHFLVGMLLGESYN